MKKGIGKTISIITILTMTFQLGMPIVPALQKETFAADTTTENLNITESEEISRNYEIKDEETWDVSANGDGSVIAKWTLNDKTLTISGTGEMKDWILSSTEDWHDAQYTKIVEKVVINEGITNIGNCAFDGCNLGSIYIPNSVTSIGEYAFYGCSSLTNITIPEGVMSIGSSAFSGCTSLESVNIPEGITIIEFNTFRECSSLENINIPEKVTNINAYAFYGCNNLTSINIPENVRNIEGYAFYGCDNLTSINIPEGVNYIGSNVFSDCSSLNKIQVDIDNKKYSSQEGILFDKEMTTIKCYPAGKKDKEEYIIPNSVIEIGKGAFAGCSNLTSIKIPEGVTSIESSAFFGCSSLESINIPEGLRSISSWSFVDCSSLKNITIPSSVTSIDMGAFQGCSNLINVNISEGLTSVESQAFMYCNALESISIPSSVISIGTYAIPTTTIIYAIADSEGHKYAEEKKQGYILVGEATEISTEYEIKEEETWDISANEDGSIIAKWTLNDKTLTISGTGEMKDWTSNSEEDWHKQYKNIIEKVVINGEIINVGKCAFYKCSNLESIDIPSNITSIGYGAFEECSELKSITIPDGVTDIKSHTFEGCSSLKGIVIPKGVTSIGSSAFSECSSLDSIIISKGVTNIGSNAFNECSSLIIYTNYNSTGHRYAEENKQAYIIDDEGPAVTFTPNESINPQKEYTVKVNVEDNQEVVGVDKESLKYLWTQSETEPAKESFIESFENGQTITKNTGDGKWYLWVYAKDNLGNETITRSEVFNFDNTAPNGKIEYSTKEPTKENVTVTITSNEEIQEVEGWTLSSDKKVLTKEYTENTKEIITVKDLAGNEAQANIEISNIDKTAPNGKIEYSAKEPTNKNVTVKITSNEEIQEVEGWTLSSDRKVLTKEYTENTKETITVKDLAGNETEVNIEISNIDKTAPNGKIEYSTKELTNKNVIVTITANEEVQNIEGWNLSNDKKTLTKEYTENAKETITIKDIAGNEAQANIEISNIDKTAPSVNVSYSTKDLTKENVIVTITSSEELQNIEGWNLSSDKKILTKEYTANTKETITVKDMVGNEIQVNIEITNIDKTVGDINQDGKIDVTDFLMLKRHLVAGNKTDWILTGKSLLAADMNEDGNVDITDMLMLKRIIVEDM